MLLKLSFVFAICYFIQITETHHLSTNSNTKYAVAKNREELINIIRSLKYYQNEHNNVDEPDTNIKDEEKEKKLQNILWLLNKNYNAQKHFEYLHNNGFHTASRLYLIKNPLVLEEYKNHLNNFRRFSKNKTRKNIDQQNNLKNKLRNMRRDAIFRLGSSESYSDGIDKKEESETKVKNGIQMQSYNLIPKVQEKKVVQFFKKDVFEEYPDVRDTLELHNTNAHNILRSDYDFRREKSKWDERHENSNTVDESRKKKNTYRNQPSPKKNRFSVETLNWDKIKTKDNWDKITTKDNWDKITTKGNWDKITTIKYKKKKTLKEFEYKIKPSYNRPKNDNMNKEFRLYGRTSIPFVGKRGIYEE